MAGSIKRERELARLRAERQAARRMAQRARQRRRNAILASVLSVLVVIAGVVYLGTQLGGDDPADSLAAPGATATPAATPSADPGAAGDCAYPASQRSEGAKDVGTPPTTGIDKTKPATATLTTNRGKIAFSMLTAQAPCTVNSFRFLASKNYFDNTQCHRLTTQGISVLQCGDPTGTGSGGPGYQFADENLEGATYPRGTVAMANAGPGTNGSQFFLVYKDSQLPPNYTVFGKITAGLEVIDAIAKAGVDGANGDGKPKAQTTIQDFAVT